MAQLNIRIDAETKKSAEKVLDEIGMSMTTAITIFLKTVARERRIPFEISADPFYSEDNRHYLEQKRKAYKEGSLKTEIHSLTKDRSASYYLCSIKRGQKS